MEKQLIYTNEDAIKTYDRASKEILPKLQYAADQYKKLGINVPLSIGLLLEMQGGAGLSANDSKARITAILKRKLAENEQLSIGGLRLNQQKIADLIELPIIDEFVNSFADAILHSSLTASANGLALGSFSIEDDKVVINLEEREKFVRSNTHYAETEGEIKCANIVLTLCKALNDHHKAFNLTRMDAIDDPPWGVRLSETDGYLPDIKDIRRFGPAFEKGR